MKIKYETINDTHTHDYKGLCICLNTKMRRIVSKNSAKNLCSQNDSEYHRFKYIEII